MPGHRGRPAPERGDALHRPPQGADQRRREPPRPPPAADLGEAVEELLEADLLGVIPGGVGLARLAPGQRQHGGIGEVIDVDGEHHRVPSGGHRQLAGPGQLQGAQGPGNRAWPVDVTGAQDDGAAAPCQAVGGALRVDVGHATVAQVGGLVLGRGVVVAIDDHRADLKAALDARLCRGAEHGRGAADVDPDVLLHRSGVADDRRRVHRQVGALESRADRRGVGDVGDPRLGPRVLDPRGRLRRGVDPDHLGAGLPEASSQRTTDEAPRPGDRDAPAADLDL